MATLKKVVLLLEQGGDTWDLSSRTPNRVTWLAPLGWRATNQQLQRMPPARRYPILLPLLHQALHHHTDVAVALSDQCVWEYHGAAQQELLECRKAIARTTNEKLLL